MADTQSTQEQARAAFASAVKRVSGGRAKEIAADIEFFINQLSDVQGVSFQRLREELAANPERFISEFGISYEDITSSLSAWNRLAKQYLGTEFFNPATVQTLFGLGGGTREAYSTSQFAEDAGRVKSLLREVESAVEISKTPEAEAQEDVEKEELDKKAEEEKEQRRKRAERSEEESIGPEVQKSEEGAVVPASVGLGAVSSKLQGLVQGDVKIRQEIVRSQQMVLRQLAIAYGVPEKQQDAFIRSLASDLTPIISHELFSMGAADLSSTLKSSSVRYQMYRKVLMRAQQSAQFQAMLGLSLQSFSPAAKGMPIRQINEVANAERANNEISDSLKEAERRGAISGADSVVTGIKQILGQNMNGRQRVLQAKNALVTPDEIVEKIRQAEERLPNKGALTDSDIGVIVQTLQRSQGDILADLRVMLAKGARLTESQIAGIESRLQAYALLGSSTEQANVADFERIFLEGFGREGGVIAARIQRAMGQAGLSWGSLSASYIRAAKMDVVARTGNSAALFSDSTREPSKVLVDQIQKEVYSRGFEASALGMYAPASAIKQQLQQISSGKQASSIARLSGKVSPSSYAGAGSVLLPSTLLSKAVDAKAEPQDRLKSALDFKKQGASNFLAFARTKQNIVEKVESDGFSKETFQEIHWNEKVEYIRSLLVPEVFQEAAVRRGGVGAESVLLREDYELYRRTISEEYLQTIGVEFVVPEMEFLYEIVQETPDVYEFYLPTGQPLEYELEFVPLLLQPDVGVAAAGVGIGAVAGAAALSEGVPAGFDGLRGRLNASRKSFGGELGRIRQRAANKRAMLQNTAVNKKRKLQQRALLMALAAVPGGQALLPLVKAGFVALDKLRKIPGGEKVLRFVENLMSPDKMLKENLRRAFLGAAALGGLALAGALAFFSSIAGYLSLAGKLLGMLGATGMGFLVGNLIVPGIGGLIGAGIGFVGSGLALFGGEIAAGLKSLLPGLFSGAGSLTSQVALVANSAATTAMTGIGSAAQTALAGIKGFFGSIFGSGVGIGFITAPIAGASITVMVTSMHLNQEVLQNAFLTERSALSVGAPMMVGGSGINAPGCWPITGDVLAMENYCDGSGRHSTLNGVYGASIDISVPSGHTVYAPFGGTAIGYSRGTFHGRSYGNAVVLKADNGSTFIFAHLQDDSFEVGKARVVAPGDVLALSDSTGNSSAPHLHYEVIGGDIRNFLPVPNIEACKRIHVVSDCAPK